MDEVNESNVAVKMTSREERGAWREELDPQVSPIITENVPMTTPTKPVSKPFLICNIVLNFLFVLMPIILLIPQVSDAGKIVLVSITIACYMIYMILAYSSSSLLALRDLRSLHQYRDIYARLTEAECSLKFSYIASRSNIDQSGKKIQKQYQEIEVIDRSGELYPISKKYEISIVRYKKKYFYTDNNLKGTVNQEFARFVQHCREQNDPHSRKLLQSQQKIEFLIEGMLEQMGYYIQQDHHYRCYFYCFLFFGLYAYYQIYMKDKVLRYQVEIVKEICAKPQQKRRL